MNEMSSYHEMVAEQIRAQEDKLDRLKMTQQVLDQLDFSVERVQELVIQFFDQYPACSAASPPAVHRSVTLTFSRKIDPSLIEVERLVHDKFNDVYHRWLESVRADQNPLFGYSRGKSGGLTVKARLPITQPITGQTRLSELRKLVANGELEPYAHPTPRGWLAASKLANDLMANLSLVDNHTCRCGNTKCNKTEKSCWKCGAPIQ